MSEFACPVVRVEIIPHPNADAIEIAKVGDYQSIVRKGQFKTGDLAVYIPEQAIVPDWLLEDMGLKGKLSGSGKNRVKAIKLRGILSQGLVLDGGEETDGEAVFPSEPHEGNQGGFMAAEGDEVSEELGIVKYEPTLPSYMAARTLGADYDATIKYDFENVKKNPTMFEDGEEVVMTEKIHGTFMMIGVLPPSMAKDSYYKGRVIMSSKGMSAKGFVLDPADEGSVYAQACRKLGILDKMLERYDNDTCTLDEPVYIMGEVYGKAQNGKSIQDGFDYGKQDLHFAAFDIATGKQNDLTYLPHYDFLQEVAMLDVDHVPVLYVGPFSKDKMLEVTDGKETVSGFHTHIREGVVVKHITEAKHPHLGRKIAKSISEAYLLRKGGTEFQ